MENSILEEKYLQTHSGKVYYYQQKADPKRPTVVFLHGLSANHTTWKNVMVELAKHNFNSLALDIRGHGKSDQTKKKSLYTIANYTKDLQEIVEKENLKKFILVGYSYGGPISINYALKFPEKVSSLILISANHNNPLKYWHVGFLTPVVYAIANGFAYLLLAQNRKKYRYYEHGTAKSYWQSSWTGMNSMPYSINIWMLLQMVKFDFSKDLNQIKVPTLLVCADKDLFLSKTEVYDMVKALEKSEVVFAKHDSHFLATRSQGEIIEIIINFLQKHEDSNL